MSAPSARGPGADPRAAAHPLLRVFGFGFGLAVVIGGVIGSGILRNPGVVAAGFPDARLALLAWCAGGLFVAIDAMPTVELGASVPMSGGPYALAERAFGPGTGFMVGWADWLQNAISTGFITVAFGEFAHRLGRLESLGPGEIAVGLVLACGALNWAGARIGGLSQNIGSAAKAIGLLLLVAALFALPAGARPSAPPAPVFTLAAAAAAIRAIYGAYGGWHAAVYFSEEVVEPERTVARATFTGIALVTVLYALVNAAVAHVLPIGAIAASTLPVSDAARVVIGPRSADAVTWLAMISLASIANLQIMEHTRVTFAMARNGALPASLTAVSRSGAPRASLTVVLVATSLIIAGAALLKGQLYLILLNLYAPMVMLVFLALALAAIRLRQREPDLPRPWRMPAFPAPALLSAAVNALLLGLFLWSDPRTGACSFGLLAIGWPLFRFSRRGGAQFRAR